MIILTELLPTNLRATLEKGAISRQEIITIGSDICKALHYLRLMRPEPLVHRDVSSANILLLEPFPYRVLCMWKMKLTDIVRKKKSVNRDRNQEILTVLTCLASNDLWEVTFCLNMHYTVFCSVIYVAGG